MYNDYLDYSYYSEGANMNIRALLKEAESTYKKMMHECRLALAHRDFDKAHDITKKLSDEISSLKDDIENIDGSNGISIIAGYFFSWTINWLRNYLEIVLSPVTFGVSGIVSLVQQLIERWKRPVKKLVGGERLSLDDFNFYKNTALKRMDTILSVCQKMDAEIDKAEKFSDKVTKEGVALMDFKYALDMAYESGLIIDEDRRDIFRTAVKNLNINENVSDEDDYEDYDYNYYGSY